MAKIIVSADYFGSAIQAARHHYRIEAPRMAQLLDCTTKKLHRYEAGVELIPQDILRRVFQYAAKMDACLEKE